jgi:deazaflavin-dependent oxidoreductase (nitroreductase family)
VTDLSAPTDPPGWPRDHVRRYVETAGREGHEWRDGVYTLLLTTKGRRSGRARRTPLIYGHDGDRYVVVASKGGSDDHPEWYRNLRADPEVAVQVAGERFPAQARTATGEERAKLWSLMTGIWPDYDQYQRRTGRRIPVVVLERDNARAA